MGDEFIAKKTQSSSEFANLPTRQIGSILQEFSHCGTTFPSAVSYRITKKSKETIVFAYNHPPDSTRGTAFETPYFANAL